MLAKHSIIVDKNNNKIRIENAQLNSDYYCPFCGNKVTVKINNNNYCFSHENDCVETWNYDNNTEWHKYWQSLFIEHSNVIVKNQKEAHFADILINNTVIELQQSRLNIEEFRERNKFFSSLGYKIIWIFDLRNEVNNGYLNINKEDSWVSNYRHQKQPLKQMDVKKDKAMIFIQTSDIENDKETKILHHVYWHNSGFSNFISDEDNVLTPTEFKEIISDNTKDFAFNRLLSKHNTGEFTNMPFVLHEKSNNETTPLEPTTLKKLWNKSHCPLIAENIENGKQVVIYSKNYRIETNKNGKIIGNYLEELEGYYRTIKHLIKDSDKSIWKYAEEKIFYDLFNDKYKNRYKNNQPFFYWNRLDSCKDVKNNEKYKITYLLDKYKEDGDWFIAKSLVDNEYYYFKYNVYSLYRNAKIIDYCDAYPYDANRKAFFINCCINDYIRQNLLESEWILIGLDKTKHKYKNRKVLKLNKQSLFL